MILDNEKRFPPPPYSSNSLSRSSSSSLGRRQGLATLPSLPAHILLQIVYTLCPPELSLSHRRIVLYWMETQLRYVCRDMWIACMHVLRSSYLPLYASLIQPPYTTDPFPASTPTSASSVALTSIQRETAVLDMFIRLKVEEDVRADESELYLDQGHFTDLFNLLQPRSRLEDLVRKYGSRAGLISNSTHSAPPVVPFSSISVTWGLRVVGVAVTDSRGRKRTIVQVSRDKSESLEIIAKRLVREWGKGVKG